MNIAARQRRIGRLGAHLDAFDIEAVLLEDFPLLRGKKKTASQLMPRVHRVIALLKQWLMGTHQSAFSHKHLEYYLDEFTFRFKSAAIKKPLQALLPPRAAGSGGGACPARSDSNFAGSTSRQPAPSF